MTSRALFFVALLGLCAPAGLAQTERAKTGQGTAAAKDQLTLERLFPKKSFFGPSARSVAFSADGRYAAYLYRTYPERRHGADLWIYDAEKGTTTRVTSVSVMAPFQKAARKVRDDRLEKWKKRQEKEKEKEGGAKPDAAKRAKADAAKSGAVDAEERAKIDTVDEKDADDEKAPRYGGVSALVWAPEKGELLFTSGGDIYRLAVGAKDPERLTATRSGVSGVAYLPDNSGYTYMVGGSLMKVEFGKHFVEQLDPRFAPGESMTSYRISPDGKKMAILVTKGSSARAAGRKVNIANYRDRFMKVREVDRHVSDDPVPDAETSVYLYDLKSCVKEDGELQKVYTLERSGPRDVVQLPRWSEDSKKAAFSVFEQKSGVVKIVEARFVPPPKAEKPAAAAKSAKASPGEKAAEEKADAEKKEKPEKPKTAEARVVYEFLHRGGPTTPRMMEPRYLADNRRLVLVTEQTGFRQLHVLDPVYENLDQLTRGRFEVYPLEVSKDRKWLFCTSTKGRPSCQALYKVDLESGEMVPISRIEGVYRGAAVSPDGKRALANFVAYGRLSELVAVDAAKGTQKQLTDSHPEEAKKLTQPKPEFFTYENRHGHEIHGHLFKPAKWSKKDKRPLLLYVYGGPLGTSKQVTEGNYHRDSYFFGYYMAEKHGYLTCTIDPRGMSGYGGAFEKANFERVGKPQVEDLVDGVKHLIANYGVDPERVGMHGWSFGGFQTQMCLYTAPEVFKVGIAGAGPTEWENYNSWYSTGTIGSSREGTPDLKKYSLLPLAKNLAGKLLLVHGMEDSNVLYQDTVRVYRELLKAGKETLVELFLDPTGGHGLGGDVERLARARKYEEFLLRTLGTGGAGAK